MSDLVLVALATSLLWAAVCLYVFLVNHHSEATLRRIIAGYECNAANGEDDHQAEGSTEAEREDIDRLGSRS